MQRISWCDLKITIAASIDLLISHPRFLSVVNQSYCSFCASSDYLEVVSSDFFNATGESFDERTPSFSYSFHFLQAIHNSSLRCGSAISDVAFYDLFLPCCYQFSNSLFSEFSSLPWYAAFLKSAVEELVRDLSDCLSPCLFDLFSETLSFGLQIERFYVADKIDSSKPRFFFDQFITDTLDSSFFNLIQTYPLSIYFLGQTLFYWHHRHLELLIRIRNDFDKISQCSFDNLTSLSFSSVISGDNHNFNRRSYVLQYSTTMLVDQFVCYKPRNLANDCFFSDFCQNILQTIVDQSLVLPIAFDFGNYGFTTFIPPFEKSQQTYSSTRRDGMWLYILWFFGFTDCTYENFIFNGDHHVLIDFETPFTGFFSSLKSSLSNNALSSRALMNLSSTRTTFLPRWDLGVDDRVEVDISGLGNGDSSSILNASLWSNVNSDWMIYRSNSRAFSSQIQPLVLSDQFITLQKRIDYIVDGFYHAHHCLKPFFSTILHSLTQNNRLSSRFIFRDTAAYAGFLNQLYSAHSLSCIDNYFGVLDKLDYLILDHPQSQFVSWITTCEKLQLFNGDIPYFISDINATSLSSCFGVFRGFSQLYTSGLSFVTLLAFQDFLVKFQPLLIETSLYSLTGQTNYELKYHYLQPRISSRTQSMIKLWYQAIYSSSYYHNSVDGPFLLTFQCGTTRKDVQIQNCRPDFFSGTLGILYSYYVAENLDPSLFLESDTQFFKKLFLCSLEAYLPVSSLSSTTLGFSDIGGLMYGLQLLNSFDQDLHFHHSSFIEKLVSADSFQSLKSRDSLCLDLFSGLSGYIIGLVSCKSFVSTSYILDSIDLLMSYQREDGSIDSLSTRTSICPLGISHGVHGVLLALLHAYTETQSDAIYHSIRKLISAYDLFSFKVLSALSSNMSWCSGLCGHLVTLSYLTKILPEYPFDFKKAFDFLFVSDQLLKSRDLSFCCGQSGILASLIYLRNSHLTSSDMRFDIVINQLRSNIISAFKHNCENKHYLLYKQDLLDGFSIFPFLDDRISSDLKYLESILVFRSL